MSQDSTLTSPINSKDVKSDEPEVFEIPELPSMDEFE